MEIVKNSRKKLLCASVCAREGERDGHYNVLEETLVANRSAVETENKLHPTSVYNGYPWPIFCPTFAVQHLSCFAVEGARDRNFQPFSFSLRESRIIYRLSRRSGAHRINERKFASSNIEEFSVSISSFTPLPRFLPSSILSRLLPQRSEFKRYRRGRLVTRFIPRHERMELREHESKNFLNNYMQPRRGVENEKKREGRKDEVGVAG